MRASTAQFGALNRPKGRREPAAQQVHGEDDTFSFIEQVLKFNAAQIQLAAVIGHLSPELFVP